MSILVVWIVFVSAMQLVDSSGRAERCTSLELERTNHKRLLDYFLGEYSWFSWSINVFTFKWLGRFGTNQSTKHICVCVLFKTIPDEGTWESDDARYDNYNLKIMTKKTSATVVTGPDSSKTVPSVECVIDSHKRTIVRGYRKKSLLYPIYDIYIGTVTKGDPNTWYIGFEGYLKEVDPSVL